MGHNDVAVDPRYVTGPCTGHNDWRSIRAVWRALELVTTTWRSIRDVWRGPALVTTIWRSSEGVVTLRHRTSAPATTDRDSWWTGSRTSLDPTQISKPWRHLEIPDRLSRTAAASVFSNPCSGMRVRRRNAVPWISGLDDV